MRIILLLLCVVSLGAFAETKKEVRIYEVNKFGQTQYHKGYIKVKGEKVVRVNKYGQTQNQTKLRKRE